MTTQKEITLKEICDICGDTYEYVTLAANAKSGNIPADDLPDGYFIPNHITKKWLWICDTCGSCPECGKTLEKEPDKRANEKQEAQPCEDCQEEIMAKCRDYP
jgi:hypothetical protein